MHGVVLYICTPVNTTVFAGVGYPLKREMVVMQISYTRRLIRNKMRFMLMLAVIGALFQRFLNPKMENKFIITKFRYNPKGPQVFEGS